jgi:hypothetical protein
VAGCEDTSTITTISITAGSGLDRAAAARALYPSTATTSIIPTTAATTTTPRVTATSDIPTSIRAPTADFHTAINR